MGTRLNRLREKDDSYREDGKNLSELVFDFQALQEAFRILAVLSRKSYRGPPPVHWRPTVSPAPTSFAAARDALRVLASTLAMCGLATDCTTGAEELKASARSAIRNEITITPSPTIRSVFNL